ncbi:DUF6134 family protein [Maricaulis parjimensis]|uniref:DUF6134 family protein n=1 Tax=Maricaulis parjimensis TaxID=144023 RepID=UPI0019395CB9|nr:DUF6134 family protein [Maricaulis parjimensis]
MSMKHAIVSLMAALWLAPASAYADTPDDIVFDVYRNGTPFGEHVVRFRELGDGELEVDVDVRLRAGLGPITLFRYSHDSREIWRDGELVSLIAETFNDGEETGVTLSGGDLPVLPLSSHWRGYDPQLDRVFNTETGEPMDVEIEDFGIETLQTPNGAVQARRIRITGTLTADLWYDETGRWVGCAFQARGQDIRYVLRND